MRSLSTYVALLEHSQDVGNAQGEAVVGEVGFTALDALRHQVLGHADAVDIVQRQAGDDHVEVGQVRVVGRVHLVTNHAHQDLAHNNIHTATRVRTRKRTTPSTHTHTHTHTFKKSDSSCRRSVKLPTTLSKFFAAATVSGDKWAATSFASLSKSSPSPSPANGANRITFWRSGMNCTASEHTCMPADRTMRT